MDLSNDEYIVLEFLYDCDPAQYGECYGKVLDGLILKGLAVIGTEDTGHHNGFIAKGSGLMYRAVYLTDEGRNALCQKK